MIDNPFPGPQPYRASDRGRFYGREAISYKLECSLLTNRCVTVYGPSGAGKSSLVQASILPALIEYQDIRVARVDGWPEGEDPTRWLASAMYNDLRLGELPGDLSPGEAILAAARRAARGSSRLMVVYLDQLEQLLYPGRSAEETETFFESLHALVELPLRTVRVVLSLREDYLGRLRDRLRDRQRVLDGGFRVGPLTVAELCEAVCKTAAAGEPSQTWSLDQMRTLILQVRVPGQEATEEAEAQSAYAQIVCRALFQQRVQGTAREGETIEAERILRDYLEVTLSDLGPSRGIAERLLEDHLVTADGSRTLRTEKELCRIVPPDELHPILRALEGAAILHAEEHQGSRYFEIGHDWLARRVFEQREERTARQEVEARLKKARAQRRALMAIAGASLGFAAITGALGLWALRARAEAQAQKQQADVARLEAVKKRVEAYDQRVLAGFLALSNRGEAAWAMKLLPEVKRPAERPGWVSYASDALNTNALRVTLRGHQASLGAAAFSPDGKRVITASADGTARVWRADGEGQPVVLKGHEAAVTSATMSPDGRWVLTTSEDKSARVSRADGEGQPVVLKGAEDAVVSGAWSPDGQRVVTASRDGVARIHAADGSAAVVELRGHQGGLTCAIFLPDGARVVTASEDGTARVWSADGRGKPVVLKGHEGPVLWVAASPDGQRIVTTSRDRTARVFRADGKGIPVVLRGHEADVYHAAVSADGARVATASGDRTARIWNMDGTGEPVVLQGHALAVTYVAFRPDGAFLATASADETARVWPVDGGAPLVLRGHAAPLRSVVWSPDGALLLTAAADRSERSQDRTAKVWSADLLRSLPRAQKDAGFFHAASLGAGGARVVSAYDDNTARLRRVDSAGDPLVFKGHEGWIASATLSPRGDRVVTASFDKTARVWSADGVGEPVVLRGHEAEVRFAAMSPDGGRVVTASEDRTARIFPADGRGEPIVLRGHEDWLTGAAWSPDGGRVVTTSLDHTARVWSADGSGAPIVLSGHRGAVFDAAFDRAGRRVVTASEDGTARIWDLQGGGSTVLRGPSGPVLRAAFGEDGRRVAAASADGSIYVWSDGDAGQPIVLRTGAVVLALSFVEGDQRLLTVGADNSVHTWMIDVRALREGLSSAHADCLPAAVRAQFLGEPEPFARYAFAACESAHGRMPAPVDRPPGGDEDAAAQLLAAAGPDARAEASAVEAAPGDAVQAKALPLLAELGPNARRAKVIVLPGDAEIEVDGIAARRRDGVVELIGKVGEVRRLRVIKGARYVEQDVTIDDRGASPPRIDLMALVAAKAGPRAKKPAKPGKGSPDPLTPDSFD